MISVIHLVMHHCCASVTVFISVCWPGLINIIFILKCTYLIVLLKSRTNRKCNRKANRVVVRHMKISNFETYHQPKTITPVYIYSFAREMISAPSTFQTFSLPLGTSPSNAFKPATTAALPMASASWAQPSFRPE